MYQLNIPRDHINSKFKIQDIPGLSRIFFLFFQHTWTGNSRTFSGHKAKIQQYQWNSRTKINKKSWDLNMGSGFSIRKTLPHASPQNSEGTDVWKVARHPPSRRVVACDDYSCKNTIVFFLLQWDVRTIIKLKLKQVSKEY